LFNASPNSRKLPVEVVERLDDDGFVVIPGPIVSGALVRLAEAYDRAVANADPADVSHGSTTTRVHDLVNRSAKFDPLYVYSPLLEASRHTIKRPFKLSTMIARTVRPNTSAQTLHVDFPREADSWPMIGFIFMVDDFRIDNGATRFVSGSHKWTAVPDTFKQGSANYDSHCAACGPAGSLIVYNGSVWHGHGPNLSDTARRSIQGAFIRRDAESGVNLPARIHPDTIARISPLAKYLLGIQEQHPRNSHLIDSGA
jgi:ectoine hydroxylase-related dioxygenase (phytanoyl-CoA dioxygenase family)